MDLYDSPLVGVGHLDFSWGLGFCCLVKGAGFYSPIVCGPISFLPGSQFLFL